MQRARHPPPPPWTRLSHGSVHATRSRRGCSPGSAPRPWGTAIPLLLSTRMPPPLSHAAPLQKDPGEYLLELQRFAAIPDVHLRRHAIDAHLR